MAKLQLALDLTDLRKAVRLAERAAPYCDWIEAGTPLIKAEGLEAVRALRRHFPDKVIVADMKTMDTGAFEAGLAASAGADLTTVCGAADISTIKGAIGEARKRRIMAAVDLINVPPAKWKDIDRLKPDYICLHVGIDQQKKGMDLLKLLKRLKVRSKRIVAGGITAKTAPAAVKAGAEVVVVGGAITNAKDPARAAKEIKEAMEKA